LHEHNVAAFKRLVTATRSAANVAMGADHNPTFVLQLTHSGRWSKPDGTRQPIIAHHNPKLDELVAIDQDHPLISDDELDQLQTAFVSAAKLAATAGFDGVDVKACHGYLCAELLAAHTREGRYGGAFENRTRFLLETSQRIREEVREVFVTSRVNVYDGLPFPYGFGVDRESEDKPDLEEPLRLLGQLQTEGFPIANVTLGVPYCRPHLGRPFNRAVPGSPAAPEHPLVGVARLQQVTGELQSAYPGVPLVGTGYSWLRQFFPYVGAAAVRTGRVAVVGLGRMAFAYPDFAKDLAEHGRLDSRKSCVGCSGCSELMRANLESGCIVRDSELYHLPNPQ
jgi:2,4-dienoyl-CoA reductase-like NADH-dependent reductase (Old Yellow Enzyme family)